MESIVLRYDKGESIGSINSVETQVWQQPL